MATHVASESKGSKVKINFFCNSSNVFSSY
jgi:hypothetical protein